MASADCNSATSTENDVGHGLGIDHFPFNLFGLFSIELSQCAVLMIAFLNILVLPHSLATYLT